MRWVLHSAPEKSVDVACVGWWKEGGEEEEILGCEGGEKDEGDGLCFWNFILSQQVRENRGPDHLRTSYGCKGNFDLEKRIKHQGGHDWG